MLALALSIPTEREFAGPATAPPMTPRSSPTTAAAVFVPPPSTPTTYRMICAPLSRLRCMFSSVRRRQSRPPDQMRHAPRAPRLLQWQAPPSDSLSLLTVALALAKRRIHLLLVL